MISTLVIVTGLIAAVFADPAVIISNGYLSSPLTSAALVAPGAAPVVGVGPVSPLAPLPSVASLAVPYATVSDYRYAYGSSLSYQDYAPAVSSALTLPYSLPYAYAADWYYRN
ncbi:uncharacterized protein LOC123694283 [Colias croceus]|uniref:uncharacterized protein LOC123694283 n=1 Tax=Colias crocea TaxID=72248 RepID=UPI001E27E609|nr:uncharacterized protein LOC123694283 [Colias croceus]CAG4950319.1 unnamed protein product [Colias eurytheme]